MVATDLMERAGEDRVNGWKRTCREGAGPISHRVFFPRDEEGDGERGEDGPGEDACEGSTYLPWRGLDDARWLGARTGGGRAGHAWQALSRRDGGVWADREGRREADDGC